MSDLSKIKQKLSEDEDKIVKLLSEIGCEYIKLEQRGSLITAQLPQKFYSENRRAVQVRINENMSSYIRNRGDFKGDIFNLISYIHFDKRGEEIQKNLYNSKEFICNLFGWKNFLNGSRNYKEKIDYTSPLKDIIKQKKSRRDIIRTNDVLPESIMNMYYFYDKPVPFKDWIEEGISYKTQIRYGVGFDLESKRVVFPIRNRFGKLVGVKGRTLDKNDDTKYLYLYPCNNGYEWFNFYIALPYILSEKRVYILESEKSCMNLHSNGVYNSLGIGASDITLEQSNIIKNLGLDIEIVLCYDKDKEIDEVRANAIKFDDRKVFGMVDTDNLLEGKQAPIDEGIEVWNKLVKNNIYPIDIKNNDV